MRFFSDRRSDALDPVEDVLTASWSVCRPEPQNEAQRTRGTLRHSSVCGIWSLRCGESESDRMMRGHADHPSKGEPVLTWAVTPLLWLFKVETEWMDWSVNGGIKWAVQIVFMCWPVSVHLHYISCRVMSVYFRTDHFILKRVNICQTKSFILTCSSAFSSLLMKWNEVEFTPDTVCLYRYSMRLRENRFTDICSRWCCRVYREAMILASTALLNKVKCFFL